MKKMMVFLMLLCGAAFAQTTAPTTQPKHLTKIEQAIADHTLCNGMTLEDGNKSLGVQGVKAGNTMSAASYVQWVVQKDDKTTTYRASFSNGVIANWAKR